MVEFICGGVSLCCGPILECSSRNMNLVYNALLGLVVWFALVPADLLRILVGRSTWSDLAQRLGHDRSVPRDGSPRVIIHAVSVGEMAAVEALLPALAIELPGVRFVLTTGNRDGMTAARAMARAREDVLATLLLPWDRARPLGRWLDHLRPDLFVVMETEIWPNLYRACSRLGVPLCIANGRIYPADAGKYRLARGLFRRVLANVSWLGVQSEADRERFLAMGAPDDRIEVVGNLKYDKETPHSSHHHGSVLLAASTHPPEEELILDAFLRLRDEMPDLRCVIAPRHVARAGSIRSMVRSRGLEAARWTESSPEDAGAPVVVVDEMGWLRDLFPGADVVIMGGSFAPRGGHNLLEPAATGCAIVIGPNVEHFRAIVDDFLKRDAIRMVETPSELYGVLSRLLRDEAARVALGQRAREAWEAGRGRAPVYARKLASIMRERQEASPVAPGVVR